jgi:hypothetical protein
MLFSNAGMSQSHWIPFIFRQPCPSNDTVVSLASPLCIDFRFICLSNSLLCAKRMYKLFSINVIVCSLNFLPRISTYLSIWMYHGRRYSDIHAFPTFNFVIKELMYLFQINNEILCYFFTSQLKSTRLCCFEIDLFIPNYTWMLLWPPRMFYYKQRGILHFTKSRVTFVLMF